MRVSDTSILSLEEKIGQLFFIGIPGDRIDPDTSELLEEVKPGGICLFARNIKDAEQTRALTDELRASTAITPFLSIDQEGGLVDRLRRLLGPMPAAAKLTGLSDVADHAETIAVALRSLGLNMDFAPVIDVVNPDRSIYTNGLHSRAYGSSAEEVSELSGTFLERLQAGGILGCLKHFPGLGASQVDSHEELPVVGVSEDEFNTIDLLPYKRLLAEQKVEAVMVAHAAYPQLGLQETGPDGKLLPSSLSSNIVTKLLRNELGFDGLVLTDDLEMGAILRNYGVGDASLLAVLAGNDMVSICAGVGSIREAYVALVSAAVDGRLPTAMIDAAVRRIVDLKNRLADPVGLDIAQFAALSQRILDLNERIA